MSIIFDYGGTIDTDSIHWADVIWQAYQHMGIEKEVSFDHYRLAYVHAERSLAKFPLIKPEDNFLQLLVKKIDIQTSFLVDARFWPQLEKKEKQRKELSDRIARWCYDFVLQTLKKSRGVLAQLAEQYPLVLVSNFYGNIHAILDDFQLNYFKAVIESAVVGVRKPNPRIFQLGVDELGMKPDEVVVVGDSFDKDILPARSIGCKTVWVKGTQWDNTRQYDETIPDAVITSITQVPSALSRIFK